MDASTQAFIQLLDQINREAGYAIMQDGNQLRDCIDEYNDIYDQISRENGAVGQRFSRLSMDASAGTVRMVVRDLIFFLEHE